MERQRTRAETMIKTKNIVGRISLSSFKIYINILQYKIYIWF